MDPYTGYYLSGTAGLTGGSTDGRLRPKSLVVGVVAGDQARAYPIEEVRGAGVINDTFVGIPLVLVLHPDSDSVSVFRRDPTERILTFRRRPGGSTLQDLQTGSIWEPRTGLAIEGELSGRRLTRLAAPLVFWFAWSDLYRSSQVYGQIP